MVFVCADYAAIELRVLTQVTGDERLSQVFGDGGDPHRLTASLLIGKSPEDVSKEERQRAKAVNFGFAFGMGPDRFVAYALSDFGVVFSRGEAKRFKTAYLRAYPGVDRWQRETARRRATEVRTASGRVRYLPDRAKGYTERLNTPVQGTAADGLKAAMFLLAPRLAALGARVVLCVHDELLVEAPVDRAEEVEDVVKEGMQEGMETYVTSVPIVVEPDIRQTWAKGIEKS
jgi:DNA polymerase-1